VGSDSQQSSPGRPLWVARAHANWVRTFASALVVGGGGAVVTMLLGAVDIPQDIDAALDILYGGLLLLCLIFSYMTKSAMGDKPQSILGLLVPGIGILAVGISTAFENVPGPIKAHTADWWGLVGVALIAAFIGVTLRMTADTWIESIDRRSD
jgi:hypothetical protein